MKSPELQLHQTDSSSIPQDRFEAILSAVDSRSTRRTEVAYAAVVMAVGAMFLATAL